MMSYIALEATRSSARIRECIGERHSGERCSGERCSGERNPQTFKSASSDQDTHAQQDVSCTTCLRCHP